MCRGLNCGIRGKRRLFEEEKEQNENSGRGFIQNSKE
jgi:hypothetical protein